MSDKHPIKDSIENVRDAVDEALHRSTAEAEHARRDVAGDDMTLGDKIKSGANEATNRMQATIDKAKREARSRP